jgi:hypothetical protein
MWGMGVYLGRVCVGTRLINVSSSIVFVQSIGCASVYESDCRERMCVCVYVLDCVCVYVFVGVLCVQCVCVAM